MTWRSIAKISASQKFPVIRYANKCSVCADSTNLWEKPQHGFKPKNF